VKGDAKAFTPSDYGEGRAGAQINVYEMQERKEESA